MACGSHALCFLAMACLLAGPAAARKLLLPDNAVGAVGAAPAGKPNYPHIAWNK
jgi:hypothetical protein